MPSSKKQNEEQSHALPPFQWSKHWYPVSVEDCLQKDKPNKVTLLGRDYVVWEDKGLWNVARDECPHRSVPWWPPWLRFRFFNILTHLTQIS